jgi:hypothetical protein
MSTKSSDTFTVRQAFRVPKDGGVLTRKPYRFYEVGTKVTPEDVLSWGADAAVDALVAGGQLEPMVPVSPAPASAPAPALKVALAELAEAKSELARATAAETAAEAAAAGATNAEK